MRNSVFKLIIKNKTNRFFFKLSIIVLLPRLHNYAQFQFIRMSANALKKLFQNFNRKVQDM